MGVEITLFRSTNAQRLRAGASRGNLRSPTLNKRRLSGIPSSPVNGRDGRKADAAGCGRKRTTAFGLQTGKADAEVGQAVRQLLTYSGPRRRQAGLTARSFGRVEYRMPRCTEVLERLVQSRSGRRRHAAGMEAPRPRASTSSRAATRGLAAGAAGRVGGAISSAKWHATVCASGSGRNAGTSARQRSRA